MSEAERQELWALLTMPPETRYAGDPVGWAVEALGVARESLEWSLLPEYKDHVWDGTKDPIKAMMEALARGERKVAVESATGTGKTFGAAVLVLWFLACHQNALVVTTAPKEDQLALQLWKEVGRLFGKFKARYPMASTVKLRVRMLSEPGQEDTWAAVGWACGVDADEESATRAQGFHAEHMLIITEETPGVPAPVMKAFANTCTAVHNLRLALGNPDHEQDSLHVFATSPGAVHIRVSALDHPNLVTGRDVVPGACTRTSVEEMRADLGDGSVMFNSRARGVCPAQAANALIRSEWVERAFQNYENPLYHVGGEALGVDVANSETGDKGAIARGTGPALHEVETFPCPDANRLGEAVVVEAKVKGILPKHVGVDSVGVGAGAVNEAKRLGFPLVALNGGEIASTAKDGETDIEDGMKRVVGAEKFLNLRAQMWWELARDLQHNRVAFRKDPNLKQDLLALTWQPKNGKIVVESKDQLRKRLGRSPDKGDACVYWNWVRPRTRLVSPEPEYRAFSAEALADEVSKKLTFRSRFGKRRHPVLDEGGY